MRRVLHHGTKNIERQYLFISTIWKIKIAGSYENKPSLDLRKLRRGLSFVSFSSFKNNAFI